MLFPTPRYDVEAIAKLTELVNGNVMLVPEDPLIVTLEVIERRRMRRIDFPSLDHFLDARPATYPYTKTLELNKDEALVCLHTSGTTGFPKPIIWTHDWAKSIILQHYMPAPAGYERIDRRFLGPGKRLLTTFFPFHGSGLMRSIFFPLCFGTTVIFAPSAPTPGRLIEAVANTLDILSTDPAVDALGLAIPHVEYLALDTKLLARISEKVKTLVFGGSDISQAAGLAIAPKMRICNLMASTEAGIYPTVWKTGIEPEAADGYWRYHIFHPSFGLRFNEVSQSAEGKIYEAVMVKNQDEGTGVQALFKVHTGVDETTTGDLFVQHPRDPEKWRHYGRADDMLNFLTAETFHPVEAERRIGEHADVAEVVMIGTRRPKASLVLRLHDAAKSDEVWETIEDVNKNSPVWAKIERHMVLTVVEQFPGTPKGTMRRKGVVEKYAMQLDELYQKDGSLVPMT